MDEGYRMLLFPFQEIATPAFVMTANWNVHNFLGYLATWSAVKVFREQAANDPLKIAGDELRAVWKQHDVKTISWPLVIRAGIIK